MKLDLGTLEYMLKVVKTAKLVDIDNIIIEPGAVRAIDDASSVVLYQNTDVPDMPFGSIGLNRTSELLARYEIAKAQDNFSVEAVIDDRDKDNPWARSLTMKAKGTKIEYRSANPVSIKAPRQINDTMLWKVKLNSEAVTMLQKGQAAMKAELVTIISNDEGVALELVDVNNDVFRYVFANDVELLTDDDSVKFAHRYPTKVVLSLFRNDPDGTFEVGKRGMMKVPANELTMFVLPQV